jgi:hypothetical protein
MSENKDFFFFVFVLFFLFFLKKSSSIKKLPQKKLKLKMAKGKSGGGKRVKKAIKDNSNAVTNGSIRRLSNRRELENIL